MKLSEMVRYMENMSKESESDQTVKVQIMVGSRSVLLDVSDVWLQSQGDTIILTAQ